MNHYGDGRFRAFSAGSHPTGVVNPLALEHLGSLGLPTTGFRSKGWEEFTGPAAPPLDFVFTVCDNAAGEVCPVWPGQPMTAHWGMADPAAIEGTELEKREAFRRAFRELDNRLKVFVSLRVSALDQIALKKEVDRIGTVMPANENA